MDSYKFSAFAFIILTIILVLICITVVRWHDIKGIVFINQESLQRTSGTILSSKVECRSTKYGTMYHYAISYSYIIDGKTYVSDAVTFAPTGTKGGEMAKQYVGKYPTGKVITVFYLPDEHSFSVLEPEVKDSTLIYTIAGFLIVSISLGLAMINVFRKNVYFSQN